MQPSDRRQRLGTGRIEPQRDHQLGVALVFAPLIDVSAAERLVRARVVGSQRHTLLEQRNGPVVVEMRLGEAGNAPVQITRAGDHYQAIGHGHQLEIRFVGSLTLA